MHKSGQPTTESGHSVLVLQDIFEHILVERERGLASAGAITRVSRNLTLVQKQKEPISGDFLLIFQSLRTKKDLKKLHLNSAVPKRGRTQKHAHERKKAQMTAKERKRKSAKERKRAQKSA